MKIVLLVKHVINIKYFESKKYNDLLFLELNDKIC